MRATIVLVINDVDEDPEYLKEQAADYMAEEIEEDDDLDPMQVSDLIAKMWDDDPTEVIRQFSPDMQTIRVE